jgi:hypothetical protein
MPISAHPEFDEFTTMGRRSLEHRDEFGSTRRPGIFTDTTAILEGIDEDLIRAAHDAGFALRAGY